jgi:enoyl-CoA hydratase/carnithine racemase
MSDAGLSGATDRNTLIQFSSISPSAMSEHIQLRVKNRIGFIMLDRAKALNSLSLDMVRAITHALLVWRSDPGVVAVVIGSTSEKAFCTGGDIRFFHERGKSTPQGGSALLEDFFTEEYSLNYLVHHYPKPYIALMNGIVMGGGMGIAQCASASRLRIVTEYSRIAMPEVHIGLFPDVGGSYFLSRAPGQTGAYLGVTGETIGAAEALYAGLADTFVPTSELPALVAMLESTTAANVRDAVLAFAAQFKDQVDPSDSMLSKRRTLIDRHFAVDDVCSIIAGLNQESNAFARSALSSMQQRSPLMMCVTLAQIRRGAAMNFADCLRMERTMVRRSFEHGEVLEGVRARVIDKDNAPRWSPATLEAVTPEMVSRFFEPAWPAYAHPLRMLGEEQHEQP